MYGKYEAVVYLAYQLGRLQSVINASARLIGLTRRCDHVISLVRQLHWLSKCSRENRFLALHTRVHSACTGADRGVPGRWHGLQRVTDVQSRQHVRSSSSSALIVPATRRVTIGSRSVPVAAARAWNALLESVTSASFGGGQDIFARKSRCEKLTFFIHNIGARWQKWCDQKVNCDAESATAAGVVFLATASVSCTWTWNRIERSRSTYRIHTVRLHLTSYTDCQSKTTHLQATNSTRVISRQSAEQLQ